MSLLLTLKTFLFVLPRHLLDLYEYHKLNVADFNTNINVVCTKKLCILCIPCTCIWLKNCSSSCRVVVLWTDFSLNFFHSCRRSNEPMRSYTQAAAASAPFGSMCFSFEQPPGHALWTAVKTRRDGTRDDWIVVE